MSKSILRKTVSMTALFSFIYLSFSGIIMYITPPGRIAYWADWKIFGMNKTMYNETHITISMLFLLAMVLHIWLNWKPIVNYMKNSKGTLVVFTKETLIGLVLSLVFVWGTLGGYAPFASAISYINDIREDYEYSIGEPPYPHAELTTMLAFIKRMKFDEEKAVKLLAEAGITYTMEQNLKTIADANSTDPAHIYKVLLPAKVKDTADEPVKMYDGVQNGVDMSKYESMTGSGIGQKSVGYAAEKSGISLPEALARLKKYNIEASENDKLKDLGADAGVAPMDVFIIIDSGVKPE